MKLISEMDKLSKRLQSKRQPSAAVGKALKSAEDDAATVKMRNNIVTTNGRASEIHATKVAEKRSLRKHFLRVQRKWANAQHQFSRKAKQLTSKAARLTRKVI